MRLEDVLRADAEDERVVEAAVDDDERVAVQLEAEADERRHHGQHAIVAEVLLLSGRPGVRLQVFTLAAEQTGYAGSGTPDGGTPA